MPIRFPCPKCETPLKISQKYSGRNGKCPSCGFKVTVPEIKIADPVSTSSSDTIRNEAGEISDGESSSNPELAVASASSSPVDSPQSKSKPVTLKTDVINVPRWIIFAQGALLLTVASTFFIFGLMVGSVGRVADPEHIVEIDSELRGSVFANVDGRSTPDMGAVAIVVPLDAELVERPEGKLVHPDDFKAFDNPAIDELERIGGGIVRANADGIFSMSLKPNREYNVLIVSKSRSRPRGKQIQKDLRAEIGGVFRPVEDVVGDRDFHFQKLQMTKQPKQLDVVIFGE